MGDHPPGTRMFAAHCPPPLARKITWLFENEQKKTMITIRIASMVRMLLEEAVDRHIPEDIRKELEKGEP